MQTAIIIGATSGIGRELAVRLAEAGWTVGLAGRREERLSSLAAQFPEGVIRTQVLDITTPEATDALDALLLKTGAPDLFLHVSGIGKQNPQIDEAVEKAADYILKGLRRKRRVITFDWKFRLVVGLWHLIPRSLWERMTFIKTQ